MDSIRRCERTDRTPKTTTKRVRGSIVVAVIAMAMPATATATSTVQLSAALDGASVIGGRGDPDGVARLTLILRPDHGRACFELSQSNLGGLTAARVREGAQGNSGPGRLALLKPRRRPLPGSPIKRCVHGKEQVLERIAYNPTRFYADLDTRQFRDGAVRGQFGRSVGGFEDEGLAEFDEWAAANGSLAVTGEQAYEGTRAARASNRGIGNQYQRVWYDVHWPTGANVWYGLALFIPRLSDWCWWSPIRWDNWTTYRSEADVGGLVIERGMLSLVFGTYDAQTTLIGPVTVPAGRWVWVEVHQRFSARDGRAKSRLFVNGTGVGSSNAANSAGRPIDQIRYGNVAMASRCSVPSTIYFDRVSLTAGPRGP